MTPPISEAEILTGRHGHTGSGPVFILNIYDLMIDNIIPAFIYASAIRTGLERLCDILNIQNVGIEDMLSPLECQLILT
jgi:hypothetical protein